MRYPKGGLRMEKYVRPEMELMSVKDEDIITLSYMLPEMPIEEDGDVNPQNGDAN